MTQGTWIAVPIRHRVDDANIDTIDVATPGVARATTGVRMIADVMIGHTCEVQWRSLSSYL